MKTFYPTVLLILLLCYSCNPVEAPGNQKRFENKSFVNLLYESEEECMANQSPDFFENCHQQIDFLEDGKVEIMLSDIIWRGEYTVQGNKIIMKFPSNPEISEGELVFEIINSSKLRRVDNGTVWKKVSGNSIWK